MGQVCCQPISHARPHAGSPNGRSTMPAKLKDLANSPTTETRARAVFAALRRGCRRLGILSGLSNVRRRYLQITSVCVIPYIDTAVPCMRAGTSPTLVGGVACCGCCPVCGQRRGPR